MVKESIYLRMCLDLWRLGGFTQFPKHFFLLFFLKILDKPLKFTIAITQMLVIVTKVLWRLKGFRDV